MSERMEQLGEDKHARCRHGLLTEAWRGDGQADGWTPAVIPICTFALPEPCPPALKRLWGGGVDLVRDCAVCLAFREVEPLPTSPNDGAQDER